MRQLIGKLALSTIGDCNYTEVIVRAFHLKMASHYIELLDEDLVRAHQEYGPIDNWGL